MTETGLSKPQTTTVEKDNAMCTSEAPGWDGSVPTPATPLPDVKGLADLGDVAIWPDPDDAARYIVLPLAPRLAVTRDGAPRISLLDAGDRGFMQIAAEWGAAPERLEAIRADLEAHLETPVSLSPAPLDAVSARLTTTDGTEICDVHPSDLYPHGALLSLSVDGEMRAAALAAMNGNPDHLILEYNATLSLPQTTELRITGTLDAAPSTQAILDAFQSGALTLVAPTPTDIDDLLSEILMALMTTHRPGADGAVALTLTRRSTFDHDHTVAADLGALTGGAPSRALLLPSAHLPAPPG